MTAVGAVIGNNGLIASLPTRQSGIFPSHGLCGSYVSCPRAHLNYFQIADHAGANATIPSQRDRLPTPREVQAR